MTVISTQSRHQRSTGTASVAMTAQAGRTRLAGLRQQGSAKAIILDGPAPEVVYLNTSGGLTGGDRLEYRLGLGAQARATATTQTAERVYRAGEGQARISLRFDVGEGGHLDWLPQETILFERASARRCTEIRLGRDATCLSVETLVLGRAAMGEVPGELAFHDWREVTREGRPLHVEALKFDAARLRPSRAGLDGARAVASVVRIGPGAEPTLALLRPALRDPDCRAVASAPDDARLVLRLMARDGWPLRRHLARLLTILRAAPLPRVWQI